MAVEFFIHKMSEHMDAAEIIQWLAKEGDRVEQHQPLVEVMTDKFTVEVEAPAAGLLQGIRPGVVVGAVVPVGEALAFIAQPGEETPILPPFSGTAVADQADVGKEQAEASVKPQEEAIGPVRSTPVARRLAKDLGVDVEQVTGTGPGGRVTEQDVRSFHTEATAPSRQVPPIMAPTAAPAAGMPFHWQALTPVQRITGERMRESVVNAPQFALSLSIDATNLLWLREALMERVTLDVQARLSITAMLIKIVATVLPQHPRANAEFAGDKIKLHDVVNIGVAVGTHEGLVVPVIKAADRKSLADITRELAAFQEKAQTLHFAAEDLSGGTFTLSNLGMFGVEQFAAILNPPQSAILAVGAVMKTPVALDDDTVAVRPMMSLTLTVDHRVLDGLQGARFLGALRERIEKPYFLL